MSIQPMPSFDELSERIRPILDAETGTFSIAFLDLSSGLEWNLFSRPMRSASLIKLFIMVEAFDQIKTGHLKSSEFLAFTEQERVAGAGLLQHFPAGTSRNVLELIELMITESDNIATNLLIDRLGKASINSRIQSLGCKDSVLRRRMMDFAAAAAGEENLTSVRDVASVLTQLHQGLCVNTAVDRQMCEILGRQTDRCKIPLLLPPDTVCRHKTGELPGAEHDAGIVLTPKGAFTLVIMSDDLADPARGIDTIARIAREVYDWFVASH